MTNTGRVHPPGGLRRNRIADLLRGTQRLCMDLLDQPTQVHRLLEEIDRTWNVYRRACFRLARSAETAFVD